MYNTKSTISILERLSLLSVYVGLPFSVLGSIILSPFLARTRGKRMNRIIAEAFSRFLIVNCSPRQLQHVLGPSTERYIQWAKKRSLQPVVEDVNGSEGAAKLMWMTEKRTDRVLFYVHGGGYMTPFTDNMIGFCPGLREALLKQTGGDKDIGIVALVYTVYPATFPTQLTEFTLALTQLISSGVSPENIILIGDSAGANLVIQLITHTLRPVPNIPSSPFSVIESIDAPRRLLGGIILVSPWISLGTPVPSYARNTKYDFLSAAAITRWGSWYMKDVKSSHIPWVKPSSPSLFKGIETMVSRVLITAGGRECLLDDATTLFSMLEELQIPKEKLVITLDIEERGIHEDSILDIESPQSPGGGLSEATMRQVDWIKETFEAATN
ncbi:Alpha/Beta hydrolase protein [Lentinula aciculospora]|uniref:Alpha/Beta hydrolase protein n=1 Tax=Lentinula aciculospora TaxID=153920 RepID=A0A9W9DR14_9AGAR|nr:Alpha/Beta hydrolase protein [Lentinula aciculospora]